MWEMGGLAGPFLRSRGLILLWSSPGPLVCFRTVWGQGDAQFFDMEQALFFKLCLCRLLQVAGDSEESTLNLFKSLHLIPFFSLLGFVSTSSAEVLSAHTCQSLPLVFPIVGGLSCLLSEMSLVCEVRP